MWSRVGKSARLALLRDAAGLGGPPARTLVWGGPMLSSLLTVGTKLYGLRKFLMESREPTNGFYRLVSGM